VVALLGLFQHRQVGVLVFLLRPGRAVDALEHLVLAVAAPIGAGHLHQLEHLELAGGRHVRAAAQVDEVALAVQRDRLVVRDRRDDLGLVLLAYRVEEIHRVVALPFLARDDLVLLGQLQHLVLDGGQVLGRERPRVREIVVEAVVDDRADRDLGLGEQRLDRVRQ